MTRNFSSWEGAPAYQIYPATFNEFHEDPADDIGKGNLAGITAKTEYLDDLGVEVLWISPFYPSPMIDGGYDVANYTDVHPDYGSLNDFDTLVARWHATGNKNEKKVMVDIVPNHTSDQHPWFVESISSRDNPKRDWYIWHDPDPITGGPPNNWSSVFSLPQLRARKNGELNVPEGENTPPISAWQYDEPSGQYYLRDFAAEQPNLNWQNPEVREAMKEVLRFWLRRDVDGFRVDVANHLGKDPQFRNEAPNPDYIEGVQNPHDQHEQYYSLNYPPTLYPYLEEFTAVLHEDEFKDRDLRMVLECWMKDEDLAKIDQVDPKASSFHFTPLHKSWDAPTQRNLVRAYFDRLPRNNIGNMILSNHDVPRVASRLGAEAARAAATLNLSLPRIMPFIYNGEEGGFTDVDVPPERRQDDDLGLRDGARTPMLWDKSSNAGFSHARPDALWLPTDPGYELKNLERQASDPHSFFSLYRTLLHLRKSSEAMRHGDFHALPTNNAEHVFAFADRYEDDQTITVVNFSGERVLADIQGAQQALARKIVSSLHGKINSFATLDLAVPLEPHEAAIFVKTT